ncbi:MAG: hypothetical protein OWR62_10135 [Sulfobacillus thermotolerans]|nr:hypothetical protein [Sulfobacillus thermotolerans]
MTLTEFFGIETGMFAQAFQPLQIALTRQAERVWTTTRSLPPWLTQAGKGGAAYRRCPADPEVSLYRHVMDVAVVASYLFFFAWQNGRVVAASPEDVGSAQQALAQILLIAFVHDADKYVHAPSQSPSDAFVAQVIDDLNLSLEHWHLSLEQLATAVSMVEQQRGLPWRLTHAPLPESLEQLAEFVAEGDNVMSLAWRKMPTDAAESLAAELAGFIAAYNIKQSWWAQHYGTPPGSLQILQWRGNGILLQRLFDCLVDACFDAERYPFAMERHGEILAVGWPKDVPLEPVFETLEDDMLITTPTIQRADTTGKAVLQNGSGAQDLVVALENDVKTASRFLTIHRQDWNRVEAILRGWIGWVGVGVAVPTMPPTSKKLFVGILPPAHDAWAAWPRAYQHAVALAAAVTTDGIDSWEQRWERLLKAGNGRVQDALAALDMDWTQLHLLTATTVAACLAAQHLSSIPLERLIEEIHGPFASKAPQENVVNNLVNRLRAQVGLVSHESSSCHETPYQSHPNGGTCLICGTPTDREIVVQDMPVLVGRSAFNNRIGHQKSLWSQSEPNYLCESCLHMQALTKTSAHETDQTVTDLPLQVATPVRRLVVPPLRKALDPTALRSYDAVGVSHGQWMHILPWQSDLGYVLPLNFEQPAEGMEKILDQLWRFSRYAWISGEPVQVFVTHQRAVSSAFYYEPMPVLLQTLFQDLLHPDGRGVPRENLERFVGRAERLRTLVTPSAIKVGGVDALWNVAVYQWWAIAGLAASMARKAPDKVTADQMWKKFQMMQNRRDFPMPNYDDDLQTMADIMVTNQRIFDSGNDYTWVLREALMIWETTDDQSPLYREHALRGQLRNEMVRRQDWGPERDLDASSKRLTTAIMHLLTTAEQNAALTALFQRHVVYALESLVREIRGKRGSSNPLDPSVSGVTDNLEI